MQRIDMLEGIVGITSERGKEMKPGIQTTEFWTVVLTHVIAVLTLFDPRFQAFTGWSAGLAPLAAAASTVWYTHSRTQLKRSAPSTVAQTDRPPTS